MFRFLFVLLSAAAVASAQPPRLEFKVLGEGVLQDRLRLANPNNPERYKILKGLFAESGCRDDILREQPVRGSKEPNMICGLHGTGDHPRRIVVGAHFDCNGGDGIIDDWSGAVLLPTLFEFVAGTHRRHAFEFVAFSAEEKGLLGSRAYLKSIPKSDRDQIAVVIVMDSLGLTPTKCWVKGSTARTRQFRVPTCRRAETRLSRGECRPSGYDGFPALQRSAYSRTLPPLSDTGNLDRD